MYESIKNLNVSGLFCNFKNLSDVVSLIIGTNWLDRSNYTMTANKEWKMNTRVLKISTIVHHNLYPKTAEVPVGGGRGSLQVEEIYLKVA